MSETYVKLSGFFFGFVLFFSGVCKIFEEHLKKSNPSTPSITYDISQLFDYIDTLTDLSCLVYHSYNKLSIDIPHFFEYRTITMCMCDILFCAWGNYGLL